jgi:glycosyltransferase involved in cell wall biosynthesis
MSAFLDDADYAWRRPLRKWAFSAVARLGYAAVDLVITTSRGVARDLTVAFGVDPSRIRVVPNPVDVDAVREAVGEPLEPEHEARWQRPVIVAAGRLADAKNYPLLIEAMAIVRSRVPATLFVLGQGELETELRRLASQRGLGDAIVWCGFQSNPWKFMARADLFALSSRYEGFGNVLVEAMACGSPVVATRSPGTEDIVQDGVDGVLVRHSPDALAAAITQLLTDEAGRKQMAASARASTNRFARPVVSQAYARVLQEALA